MINKSTLKKIISLLSSYKKEMIITLISTMMISLVGVSDSLLLNYLIDNVLYSNAKITLLTIAIIMLLVAIFQMALRGIKNLLIQEISYKMDIDLMKRFYEKVLKIKYFFFEKHKTGELLSRLNDTRMVRNALSDGLISIIANIIMFIVVGTALICINKILFLILFASVIILSVVVLIFGRFFAKEYPVSMEKYADLQAFINESFSGIESIKTYPSFRTFKNQYDRKQKENIQTGWNIGEKWIMQNSYCSIIEKISSVFILVFGSFFVMNGKMTLGQVAGFISLSGFFTNSVGALLDLQAGVQEAFAAIKRLFEVLDEDTEDEFSRLQLADDIPEITFKNMTFSYSKENELFNDFNLTIKPGEWISFAGKTGSGKTTIAKLLLKLYKPLSGQISWNGIDLSKIDTEDLRLKIAYIPQEVVLFSGTIMQNITMFDESIKKDKIIEICKTVGIYEKIMSLESGFDTVVGERGFSLSGGEKQKIVICRALLKNPSIIIFDEATSNLDVESEKVVVEIIKKLKKEHKTIISIAHRLSTIENCDNICVLDKGKIIEQGSFLELKRKNGIFRKMVRG